jgi:shikimate kinase
MKDSPGSAVSGVRVVLVGSMAAGKSSVGRALAQRLSIPFVDTDDAIERATGRSIASLFAVEGEAEFRALESRICTAAIHEAGSRVVALGGGAFESASVRAACADPGVRVFWLRVAPRLALERARRDGATRPLLDVPDPSSRLEQINAERTPQWSTAELVVDVDERSVDSIAGELATWLEVPRDV